MWTCPSEVTTIKLYDISRELLNAPVYEGDPLSVLGGISRISDGAGFNLSSLSASVHAGTHCDAPLHCLDGGADIASMPLRHYIGRCRLITLQAGVADERTFVDMPECERLLIKGNARLSVSAAHTLVERGVITVGTDAISIANIAHELEVHRALLGGGVAVIEQLCLKDVQDGEYFLFAPPVKISGADGSFCRAVLMAGCKI